jgi:hypothetical protein
VKNLLRAPTRTLPGEAGDHESDGEPGANGEGWHCAQPRGDDCDGDGERYRGDPSDPAVESADLDCADERVKRAIAVLLRH